MKFPLLMVVSVLPLGVHMIEANGGPDCDSLYWNSITPGVNLKGESKLGEVRFGGFWEFLKTTPEHEPALIHASMTVDGYSERSPASVTCRSSYGYLGYSGNWRYHYESDEFINEMRAIGYHDYASDACGPERTIDIDNQAVVQGTVVNSTTRWQRVEKPGLKPAGYYSPSWGPGYSPEDTDLRFVLVGNAYSEAFNAASTVEPGDELASWLEILETDNKFEDNRGKPVRGRVTGQSARFHAKLPFPCGGDMQVEVRYQVENLSTGKRHEEVERRLLANVTLDAKGYHHYSEELPMVSGYKYRLQEIRYREIPDCQMGLAGLASIFWLLNAGQLSVPPYHNGVFEIELKQIPDRVGADILRLISPDPPGAIIVYSDSREQSLHQVVTNQYLYVWGEVTSESVRELVVYDRRATVVSDFSLQNGFAIGETAVPLIRYRFSSAEIPDTEQRTFRIELLDGSANLPRDSWTYHHDPDLGRWRMKREGSPFEDWLQTRQIGLNRREERRWRTDADAHVFNQSLEESQQFEVSGVPVWKKVRELRWAFPSGDWDERDAVSKDWLYTTDESGSPHLEGYHDWTGFWQAYTYEPEAGLTRITTPIGDAAPDAPAQDTAETLYYEVGDGSTFTRWTMNHQRGYPVSLMAERTQLAVDSETGESVVTRSRREFESMNPMDPFRWDASRYRENIRKEYASGEWRGKPLEERTSGSGLHRWRYRRARDFIVDLPVLCVEETTGTISEDEGVDWLEERTTTYGLSGYELSESTVDLRSGVTIFSWQALEVDREGRPTLIRYLDGSTESIAYGCCGITGRQGTSGIEESWSYTADGSLLEHTVDGVTTRTVHDLAQVPGTGQLASRRTVERIGRDGTVQPVGHYYYDGFERLVCEVDARGATTHYGYERPQAGGMLERIQYPTGETAMRSYARDGSVLQQAGGMFKALKFHYTVAVDEEGASGFALRIIGEQPLTRDRTHPLGWVETGEERRLFRDALGRIIRESIMDGSEEKRILTHRYEGDRRIKITTDADGVNTIVEHTDNGRRIVVGTDVDKDFRLSPGGPDSIREWRKQYRLDDDGQPVMEEQFSHGHSTTWERLGSRVTRLHSPSESIVEAGLVTRQFLTMDRPEVGLRETFTFHPDGTRMHEVREQTRLLATELSNEAGEILNRRRYTYDAFNRLMQETAAGDVETHYTWDSADRVTSITTKVPVSGGGLKLERVDIAYGGGDGEPFEVRLLGADGESLTIWQDAFGRVIGRMGSGVVPHVIRFNGHGRLAMLKVIDEPDPNRAIEAAIGVDDLTADHGITAWNYRIDGQPASIQHADGRLERMGYSPAGRLLELVATTSGGEAASALSIDYQYSEDQSSLVHAPRLQAMAIQSGDDAAERVVLALRQYESLATVTDASGQRRMEYAGNRLDRETWIAGALAGWSRQIVHDERGRMQSLQIRRGGETLYQVDYEQDNDHGNALGRISRIGSMSGSWILGYKPETGYPDEVIMESGKTPIILERDFRADGKLLSVLTSIGISETGYYYHYAGSGRLHRLEDQNGEYWEYDYDHAGRLNRADKFFHDGARVPGYRFAYSYDAVGNRVASGDHPLDYIWTVQDGVRYGERQGVSGTVVRGEISDIPEAEVFVNGVAAQLSRGRFAGVVEGPGLTTLEVRAQGIPVQLPAVSRHYLDAFLPPMPEPFRYDVGGNLIQDSQLVYEWDAAHRLVAVETAPSAVGFGKERIRSEFQYDYMGRRVVTRTYTRDPVAGDLALTEVRHFIYHENLLLAEIVNGEIVREYVWGADLSLTPGGAGGLEGLLAVRFPSSGRQYYPVTDGRGNIVAYWGEGEQGFVAKFEYTPFGERLRATGEMADQLPFGYSSQYTDTESGLVFFANRVYHPGLGRWLSPDPIGYRGGMHLYSFVENDPVNAFDPAGFLSFKWHGHWGGPGKVNGAFNHWKEGDDFPRIGHVDFEPPADAQDWCYYGHDTCLSDVRCGNYGFYTRAGVERGERQCDYDLSACLLQLEDGIQVKANVTSFAFKALIGHTRVHQGTAVSRSRSGKSASVSHRGRDYACECRAKYDPPPPMPRDDQGNIIFPAKRTNVARR